MIIGVGNDIVDIRRVEKVLERFGARFTDRVFTDTERNRSERKKSRAASYAKRFAAKEACSKALGTGLRKGVFWRDMGVVNLPTGQPTLRLTGDYYAMAGILLSTETRFGAQSPQGNRNGGGTIELPAATGVSNGPGITAEQQERVATELRRAIEGG